MHLRITPEFQSQCSDMLADGLKKPAIARLLGVTDRTVRRAMEALREAGAAHAVHADGGTEFAPKPARPGEAAPSMLEALARERAGGFLPAYA